jgi:hypothetical protein
MKEMKINGKEVCFDTLFFDTENNQYIGGKFVDGSSLNDAELNFLTEYRKVMPNVR